MRNKKGFTLVELLLSIALLAIITSFSWPFFSSVTASNLESDATRAVSIIRQAQSSAKTLHNDSAWGVFLDTNQMTLFSGSSYATRTVSLDQVFLYSTEVSVASTQEVFFSKHIGTPSFIGNIVFNTDTDSRTIGINSVGVITY